MLRSSFIAASSVILCATAGAQQSASYQRITGPIKDAGIYHLATGTWTRNVSATANLGPDIIYRNSATSGYFGAFDMVNATGTFEVVDEGRVPTTGGSIALADRTVYTLNGIKFGYCTDLLGPGVPGPGMTTGAGVDITLNLYDSYEPCDALPPSNSSPSALAGSAAATGLPGSLTTGTIACWTFTIDLAGGSEFCFEGDGGPLNPGENENLDLDSFGIGHIFENAAGSNTGGILAGDPSWTVTATSAGPFFPLHGGGGTYYNPAGGCIITAGPQNTGLDTQDFVRVEAGGSFGAGCYWFQGYKNTNGCGANTNRALASYFTVLHADAGECTPGGINNYCISAPNSLMNPEGVVLTGTVLGTNPLPGNVALSASGGPSGLAGYYLTSQTPVAGGVPVGSGFLCLGGLVGRYNPIAAGGMSPNPALNSLGDFNGMGNHVVTSTGSPQFVVPAALPNPPGGMILAGESWNYQMWYRDFVGGMPTSNFSNAVNVQY